MSTGFMDGPPECGSAEGVGLKRGSSETLEWVGATAGTARWWTVPICVANRHLTMP
ncbi:hypothetical protein [Aureimonas sp. AU22]|uniref:hypothetical protein n=1 Tax=Aureimonas sp. AU22 TaxID=1638162 RepID=UPI0012E3B736|nr:hypothetical protein [Aureimonas sp. AU22]